MDNLQWCSNLLDNKKCQTEMEEKVTSLIDMYFKEKSDYAIEKFIKCFCEGLASIESNLQRTRGIHPDQIVNNLGYLQTHQEETMKNMKEVETVLSSEIKRQYRNYTTFLSELLNK